MMKTRFPTIKEIVNKNKKKCQPHNVEKMKAAISWRENLADNISVK